MKALEPKEELTEQDIQHGMQLMLYDGMFSQVMGVLTGGAFLVAFALMMGASNKVIGFIAAVGPLCQLLQIPAIYLTNHFRRRKLLVVISAFLNRIFWFPVAALPLVVPSEWRPTVLVVCLFGYFGFGAIAGCAWNSWIRDLIPEKVMGSYFGRRMSLATVAGAVVSLLAALAVDFFQKHVEIDWLIYSILFLIGGVSGLIGIIFLARSPEPKMLPVPPQGLLKTLQAPLKDERFRKLLIFLSSWNFAVNLAAPFFTVYLLKRIGLEMSTVIALSVLSQVVNVLFFRIWGRLADRFTNKSVLTVSGPLFIISILIWPLTTLSGTYALTLPLILLIHMLAGMSTAGVALCSGNLALRLAPRGQATAYLAVNGLVNGLAATIAPILAGLAADRFEEYELILTFTWISDAVQRDLPAINLQGLDFLFVISGILGFYALHRLLAVKEEGEVEGEVVWDELHGEMRRIAKHVSNVSGLRTLTYFPYERLVKRPIQGSQSFLRKVTNTQKKTKLQVPESAYPQETLDKDTTPEQEDSS